MAVVALVATTNTTLLLITAASRLAVRHGGTQRAAARRRPGQRDGACRGSAWHGRRRRGRAGVAVGDLTLVASVTDFAVYLVFVAVNVAVIVLRFRQPHRRRPFRVPLSVGWVPLPTVAALLVVCRDASGPRSGGPRASARS